MILLDIIADSQDLKVLTGDIENAFIQSRTKDKIYSRCGPEFGDREHSIAVIVRALYGITTSAERFRTMLVDYLKTLGFIPSRYDRDVWMRMREPKDGYDYICTHVDDFKVVALDANRWCIEMAKKFQLKIVEKPRYYLGANYEYSKEHKAYHVGCQTYIKESVRKVEAHPDLGGKLYEHKTPIPEAESAA